MQLHIFEESETCKVQRFCENPVLQLPSILKFPFPLRQVEQTIRPLHLYQPLLFCAHSLFFYISVNVSQVDSSSESSGQFRPVLPFSDVVRGSVALVGCQRLELEIARNPVPALST